jgi:hypothetical protein
MERPLFVLDEDWRFRYVNPAGARVLDRTVDVHARPQHLGGVPRGRRQPLRGTTTRVRVSGVPAARELVRAAGEVVPRRCLPHRRRPRRHLRRRHRAPAHRGGACGGRRGAGEGGRRGGPCGSRRRDGRPAPDAAGRHQPGDDLDLRHRRGGRPVRPPGRSAAGRLVSGERGRERWRRDVGRAHRDPAMDRGDAPLRRPPGGVEQRERTRAPAAPRSPPGGHPRVHRRAPRGHGGRPEAREALAPLRPPPWPPSR